MRTAITTPSGECSTTRTTAGPQSGASCQHGFAPAPHYCTYIHPQGIGVTLYPASTPDEQLLVSFWAALVLWWHLESHELAALERLQAHGQSLSQEQTQLAQKRLERVLALDETMAEAIALVQRELVTHAPDIELNFHCQADYYLLPGYQQITASTAWLGEQLAHHHVSAESSEAEGIQHWRFLQAAIQTHNRHHQQMGYNLPLIGQMMRYQPDVKLAEFREVVRANQLLSYAEATLLSHHPQALIDPDQTDQRVFVVAHQLFEVWFPAFHRTLDRATSLLLATPTQVLTAIEYTLRARAIVRLWRRMIQLPRTMRPQDYVAFRAELRGGSGAESEQFRLVELSIGLRTPAYHQTLEQMQLLTPLLEERWKQPSLNEALMHLLVERGVFAASDSPDTQAKRLAAILLPTGTSHPHADLAALCQVALDLETELWLWRQEHIAMVRSMIGEKPSIGAGGVQNHKRLTYAPQTQAVGGLPYLHLTTRYQFFPILTHAVMALQENWAAADAALADEEETPCC